MIPVVLVRLIKVLIVLVLLANLFLWVRPVALLTLAIVNRSAVCPLSQEFTIISEDRHYSHARDRFVKASRLISQDPLGLHLWDTPKGTIWIPADSDQLVTALLAEQGLKIYGAGPTGVRPGDVVPDCSARVGVYTRVALAAGAWVVVAIEPASENLECLPRNLRTDIAVGRVLVYPKGVWDRDEYLTLARVGGNSGQDHVSVDPDGAQRWSKVPLTTIDKLVGELKLERVDFINMDIEGAERQALAGARDTLTRHKPRLAVAAYHLPDEPEMLPAVIFQAWSGQQMECGTGRVPGPLGQRPGRGDVRGRETRQSPPRSTVPGDSHFVERPAFTLCPV
jgi:FkbM family methyltransferase